MLCHQIQLHTATTCAQLDPMTRMYAWYHKGGLGGGRHGGQCFPPPLPPRIPNRPLSRWCHTYDIRVRRPFERQNNRKHVINQHARMREWVKQYVLSVRLSVRLSVSPVKILVISTFTGLNSCYTRQWHGNLKKKIDVRVPERGQSSSSSAFSI